MRRRRVAVLYTHALFGCGIAELLHADPRLLVTCIETTLTGAAEQLQRLQPHTIVVEGSEDHVLLQQLAQGLPAALFIIVRMDDNVMDVYYRRRSVAACPEDLVDVVRTGLGAHPRPAPAR